MGLCDAKIKKRCQCKEKKPGSESEKRHHPIRWKTVVSFSVAILSIMPFKFNEMDVEEGEEEEEEENDGDGGGGVVTHSDRY